MRNILILLILLSTSSPAFASCDYLRLAETARPASPLRLSQNESFLSLNFAELLKNLELPFERGEIAVKDIDLSRVHSRYDVKRTTVNQIMERLDLVAKEIVALSLGKDSTGRSMNLSAYLVLRQIAMGKLPGLIAGLRSIPFTLKGHVQLIGKIRELRKMLKPHVDMFARMDQGLVLERALTPGLPLVRYLLLEPSLSVASSRDIYSSTFEFEGDFSPITRSDFVTQWMSIAPHRIARGGFQMGIRFLGRKVHLIVNSQQGHPKYVSGVIEGSLDGSGMILIVREARTHQRILVALEKDMGLPVYLSADVIPVLVEKKSVNVSPERFLEAFANHQPTLRDEATYEIGKQLVDKSYGRQAPRALLVRFPEGVRLLVGEIRSSESLNRGLNDIENYRFRFFSRDKNSEYAVISYRQILAFTQYWTSESTGQGSNGFELDKISESLFQND